MNLSVRKLLVIAPLLLFSFLFHFTGILFASEQNLPVVTVINPIRGSEWHGKADLLASLKGQWQVVHKEKVSATWLWQYTALEDDRLVNFAKESMSNQEFGLFLEIDKNTAMKSGVRYRGQGPLYFSDGLLLVSYDRDERRKLIDKLFAKFREKFGYYPKTVGAWWIGGDSLTYMQQKYGIVAAMKAADQFDLDVYSIWGSPWSIPYLAAKENEAIPADSFNDSSKVVVIQWAPRDPLYGYSDAMFSLQDFSIQGYPFSYVDYLSTIYLRKPLDNLNVGLENGGTVKQFEAYFTDKLSGAKRMESQGKLEILPVKDYAERFLGKRKVFANSDVNYFLVKDYKSEDQSFWYHGGNYKAGIHKVGDAVYLVDLRNYSTKVNEDYSLLPNSQGKLIVSTPSIIDSMRFPDQRLLIARSKESMRTDEVGDEVTLYSGSRKIAHFTKTSLKIFPDKGGMRTFLFGKKQMTLNDRTFLFDKKEILVFSVLPLFTPLSIVNTLFLLKTFPLVILFGAYLGFRKSNISWGKPLFYSVLACVVLLYARVPYFPLDRSTYKMVAIVFVIIFALFLGLTMLIFKKTKSKKAFRISIICIVIGLAILGIATLVSRSQLILTPFEINALQVIKNNHKDVLYVSEVDYNIKPIYKAIKPILYENYHLGEKLTGTHWEIVMRPEDNVIRLKDYNNKLIVVPRYLGSDLSAHEMYINKLKKIFDNGQIAIFERK